MVKRKISFIPKGIEDMLWAIEQGAREDFYSSSKTFFMENKEDEFEDYISPWNKEYKEAKELEGLMFLIKQEMSADAGRLGVHHPLLKKYTPFPDSTRQHKDPKKSLADPLCMNCHYAPAKHLP